MRIGFSFKLPGIKGFRVFVGKRTKWYDFLILFWIYICYLSVMLGLYAVYYTFWLLWQMIRGMFWVCKQLVLLIACHLVPFISGKISEHKAKKAAAAILPTVSDSDTEEHGAES